MTEPSGGVTDQVARDEIDRIVGGVHHDPHSILGAHPGPGGVTVRALRPLAATVTAVLPDGRRFPMAHVYQGVFAATLPVRSEEHTSELQSLRHLVCRLLLEK